MPMYFGYRAHRDHGVPWRPLRSGPQMQAALDARKVWDEVMYLASRDPKLQARIDRWLSQGLRKGQIVDLMNEEAKREAEFVARREEALRRSRES